MWIVNLILIILILIFLLYMFVRIKMYVDAVTNELEDYINGIREITAKAFEKLGDKLGERKKIKEKEVMFSQKEKHSYRE